ncbi:sulfurtransferase complex subunit TusD [Thalassomonas viridans]|uniref:Sulfurtransferase complex subunit TusD n=1 Tax=Thalassomonas viridans TaxID=137584 RepID=A0AAF0C7D1_9GAMM|nr:sulfurtransferase complex subunit TusD [Thalassomonas viridans]WDE03045.1 sulfurtransferase complex subunit TusD [Thalassomonas viridans]
MGQKLAVVITTPPYSNLAATALDYVESALQTGIDVIGVFFYQDGVLHADTNISIASDEFQAAEKWQQLHQNFALALHLCVTAAEKRGLRDDISPTNINPVFTVSGLGELVELTHQADRVVQL